MQTLAVFASPLTQAISEHLLEQRETVGGGAGGWGEGGIMVAQGNSSDAPPAAILSRARSRCFYDKLGGWGGTSGGVGAVPVGGWGPACLPYHSLYEPGSSHCVRPSSRASTRLAVVIWRGRGE